MFAWKVNSGQHSSVVRGPAPAGTRLWSGTCHQDLLYTDAYKAAFCILSIVYSVWFSLQVLLVLCKWWVLSPEPKVQSTKQSTVSKPYWTQIDIAVFAMKQKPCCVLFICLPFVRWVFLQQTFFPTNTGAQTNFFFSSVSHQANILCPHNCGCSCTRIRELGGYHCSRKGRRINSWLPICKEHSSRWQNVADEQSSSPTCWQTIYCAVCLWYIWGGQEKGTCF